jgi:hypothetical protein
MGVSGRDASVKISYDPRRDRYLVQDATGFATFRKADETLSDGPLRSFERQSGNAVDQLTIYGNNDPADASADDLQLTYLSYGFWSRRNINDNQRRDYHFLFGFPSAEDTPTTGTASYTGIAAASYVDVRDDWRGTLAGTAVLTADFGQGLVSTDLTLFSSPGSEFGRFYGEADIYALDQFNGNFLSGTRDFRSGAFMGGFYGPDAAEMGYTFWLRLYPLDPYAGASLRWNDYWVSGAVVGTKD